MVLRSYFLLVPLILVTVAGCGGRIDVPAGVAALPAPTTQAPLARMAERYRFAVADELSVTVFREPELSVARAVIDPSGMIALPGIGSVLAHGMTADELSAMVSERLNRRLLRNAIVAVGLVRAAGRTITIEGAVQKTGIYPMPGRLSLIQAVSLGETVMDTADLRQVIVFRESEGRRFAARFDLLDIRAGRADDPELQPGDVVVVGTSRAKEIYRDILQILPGAAGIFVAVLQNN